MGRPAREIYDSLPSVLGRDAPEQREALIWAEIEQGNVPSFTRNFAPVVLSVPEGVDVRKVDLSIELQILAFHAQRRADGDGRGTEQAGLGLK